jgi:NADH dehydrogenase
MRDLPALRTALQGVTTVIHLTDEQEPGPVQAMERHVQDTANLVNAMQEADRRRIVYLSRMGAEVSSAYALFRMRGQTEAAVRESGLDFTILRPTLTYGPEDTFTNLIAGIAKAIPFVLPIPDAGMSRLQPLWIEDLAACAAQTTHRDDLIGGTVPIGGAEHFTLEQLAAEVLTALGIRRRTMHVRMPFMRYASQLFDLVLPRNPAPRWLLDQLTLGSAGELGSIPRCFGFEPGRFAQRLDYLRQKRPWRRGLVRFVLRLG